MKTSHIFAIIIIAVAITVILSVSGDASKYVSFKEAFEMVKKGDNAQIHVVGTLKKNTEGKIEGLEYNPQKDPNYFAFNLVDNNNQMQKVIYHNPKPADFERSEQIVIVGKVKNDFFVAEKILMKCPSKYQDGKLEVKTAEAKDKKS
jgi:cytochrome c-type biogenesis protein CcmE